MSCTNMFSEAKFGEVILLLSGKVGYYISHIWRKYMDLKKYYNKFVEPSEKELRKLIN